MQHVGFGFNLPLQRFVLDLIRSLHSWLVTRLLLADFQVIGLLRIYACKLQLEQVGGVRIENSLLLLGSS